MLNKPTYRVIWTNEIPSSANLIFMNFKTLYLKLEKTASKSSGLGLQKSVATVKLIGETDRPGRI